MWVLVEKGTARQWVNPSSWLNPGCWRQYHQGNATASVSKSGPLQAPGHDQKKAGACVIVRALIQAFFVGSEGDVKIGEENPCGALLALTNVCLRKTTDEDDNEVTVNV